MKVLALLPILGLTVNAVVTRIAQWPDFNSLPTCAKRPLDTGVFNSLKCGTTPLCVCDRYDEALFIVSSIAVTKSNCPATGVASATSVLSAFCHQLPSVTFMFTDTPGSAATATHSTSVTPALATSIATATPSPSSRNILLSMLLTQMQSPGTLLWMKALQIRPAEQPQL